MENHPIPQDVTGFKFKIIGSMTVKQFAYIVAAGIGCTITFLVMSNTHFILMIPLMAMFAGIGIALAFVPVGGRPLDKMLVYFARSIPKENQFLYHKQGVNLSNYEFFKPPKVTQQPAQSTQKPVSDANRQALASALRNSYFRPDDQEMQYLTGLKASFEGAATTAPVIPQAMVAKATPASTTQATPAVSNLNEPSPNLSAKVTPHFIKQEIIGKKAEPAPLPQISSVQEVVKPVQKQPRAADTIAEIKQEIQSVKVAEQTQGTTAELEAKIKDLEKQLADALGQTATLQQQVLQDAKQRPQQQVVVPTEKQAPAAQNVKSITPQTSLSSGFPTLPDVPNIVLGIVKDPRGKVLPNILVEVVDNNELPVRAFKTNQLGQFISATPLPNGTYKIYFDDPQKKNEFEAVQVEMEGEIFNPIEITSVDQREKLRRELFGNSPVSAPNAPVASV